MRVLGVLDLTAGLAVHARGGARDRYAPVRSRLTGADGDAVALASAYRDQLGVEELYVADLDAIGGGGVQRALVGRLATACGALWLDAGVARAADAARAVQEGAARVVVGLETLSGFGDLEEIVRTVGAERVAFSLDLRGGEPVVRAGGVPREAPAVLARRAAGAGVGAVIVLDLARVGAAAGVDLSLLTEIRRAAPDVELLAGGGVRGRDDLARLARAGCDGALVATALHDGRISREDVTAVRGTERWREAPLAPPALDTL
jgi:phosphoribosylformimino-5-aminoimidazole carboxamide ribotide isomerase